jgi:hypothetical protein
MHEFDAGNRCCRPPKLLEAKHWIKPQLDCSVILLDQVSANSTTSMSVS